MNEYTTAGFGATINGKHTWKDYGLVIGNTDIVSESSPKTNYIEVPGSSVRIDLTETLTGQVEYESRQLKFSLGKMEREDLWPVFYRTFLKAYQGKEVRVVLDQEPDVYYHGRAEVSGFSRNGRLGTFTLTVDADAYKYELNVSSEDWLWDILNFETGIIRDYRGISVSGSSSKFWKEAVFLLCQYFTSIILMRVRQTTLLLMERDTPCSRAETALQIWSFRSAEADFIFTGHIQ